MEAIRKAVHEEEMSLNSSGDGFNHYGPRGGSKLTIHEAARLRRVSSHGICVASTPMSVEQVGTHFQNFNSVEKIQPACGLGSVIIETFSKHGWFVVLRRDFFTQQITTGITQTQQSSWVQSIDTPTNCFQFFISRKRKRTRLCWTRWWSQWRNPPLSANPGRYRGSCRA